MNNIRVLNEDEETQVKQQTEQNEIMQEVSGMGVGNYEDVDEDDLMALIAKTNQIEMPAKVETPSEYSVPEDLETSIEKHEETKTISSVENNYQDPDEIMEEEYQQEKLRQQAEEELLQTRMQATPDIEPVIETPTKDAPVPKKESDAKDFTVEDTTYIQTKTSDINIKTILIGFIIYNAVSLGLAAFLTFIIF